MVKPGGTGRPSDDISARLAPLPPSSSFMPARPSALPPPKLYTHFVIVSFPFPASCFSVGATPATADGFSCRLLSLSFDLREVRDLCQGRADGAQELQAILPQGPVVGVHRHLVKESVDRLAQPRHGRHRRREIFRPQRDLGTLGCVREVRK